MSSGSGMTDLKKEDLNAIVNHIETQLESPMKRSEKTTKAELLKLIRGFIDTSGSGRNLCVAELRDLLRKLSPAWGRVTLSIDAWKDAGVSAEDADKALRPELVAALKRAIYPKRYVKSKRGIPKPDRLGGRPVVPRHGESILNDKIKSLERDVYLVFIARVDIGGKVAALYVEAEKNEDDRWLFTRGKALVFVYNVADEVNADAPTIMPDALFVQPSERASGDVVVFTVGGVLETCQFYDYVPIRGILFSTHYNKHGMLGDCGVLGVLFEAPLEGSACFGRMYHDQ